MHQYVALQILEGDENSRSDLVLAIPEARVHESSFQHLTITASSKQSTVAISVGSSHFLLCSSYKVLSNLFHPCSENLFWQKIHSILLPIENHYYNAYYFNISLIQFLHNFFLIFDSSCLSEYSLRVVVFRANYLIFFLYFQVQGKDCPNLGQSFQTRLLNIICQPMMWLFFGPMVCVQEQGGAPI